jgi:hypothetical protein
VDGLRGKKKNQKIRKSENHSEEWALPEAILNVTIELILVE